ncbi:MAG: hypothetical protein ACRC3H_00975 [Lachnospiraceae bacterium]
MNNQIKVEVVKVKSSFYFYLTILAFIVFGLMYSITMVYIRKLDFSGSNVLISTMSDTSLIFALSMFTSYFMGNQFTHRTLDNEIRIGYSRVSVVLSKAMVILPLSVFPYLAYSITCILVVTPVNGFGSDTSILNAIILFILFIFQLMSIQSFTFFIMFCCKKASLGMMLSTAFTVITCNFLRNILEEGELLFRYTSFHRIMMNSQSMTSQDIFISYLSAIATLLLMVYATYIVFRKAELK